MNGSKKHVVRRAFGFVLTELLVAGLVSSVLILGMVHMASAMRHHIGLIESLSSSQQGARFALDTLRDTVMSAAYHPRPWDLEDAPVGVAEASTDGGPGGSDSLVVHRVSERNCFGNLNPVEDASGRPLFFYRISKFERRPSGNLALTCHYGPNPENLVRQINRQGVIEGVESLQFLYAEDIDDDGRADRRVRAGQWASVGQVVGVDVALLLVAQDRMERPGRTPLAVLDEVTMPPGDGRLRRVWSARFPIGHKLR